MLWRRSCGDLVWRRYFGDADRLPTGNILGCYWPYKYSGREHYDVTYDARAAEVVRGVETEVAWKMDVFGATACTEETCERSSGGWKLYSVERFYTAPLIYGAACAHGRVSFATVNNFKQNNVYPGSYRLEHASSRAVLERGTFEFKAHWRETTVEFTSEHTGALAIVVKNAYGDESRKDLTCA